MHYVNVSYNKYNNILIFLQSYALKLSINYYIVGDLSQLLY